MAQSVPVETPQQNHVWYEEVSRYQWLALAIASLGWVFDVFEGQIFVASTKEALGAILPEPDRTAEKVEFFVQLTYAAFLFGGAAGGIAFGMLSDRIGRTRTMILTILFYSLFTCLSAFAQTWWQLAAMRFLVGLGVGGEWAVAAAFVAEVFPKSARARSLGIFHASSVLGTYLAIAAGIWIVNNPSLGWRWAFALGAAPALLTLGIRFGLRDPESWRGAYQAASSGAGQRLGRFRELFGPGQWQSTVVGAGLATVGLATFWGIHVYGKEILRRDREHLYLLQMVGNNPSHVPMSAWQYWSGMRSESVIDTDEETEEWLRETAPRHIEFLLGAYAPQMKTWEMLGMLIVTTGGGLGLLSFGPLSEQIGRRPAFLLFQLGGLASTLIVFGLPVGWTQWADPLQLLLLGGFGFLTLGMHAGFAIYFPELFPTRLRGTGSGFCFNIARVLAAPILVINGLLQSEWHFSMEHARMALSGLFLIGVVLLAFAPETKGRELPE
ncbi:MAG TPA: MFS transporter [Pirellulales bacterium]|nr:MFS transporter [Pirellulales bacterium]